MSKLCATLQFISAPLNPVPTEEQFIYFFRVKNEVLVWQTHVLIKKHLLTWKTTNTFMLFAGRGVRIEKNYAQGLA